MSKDYNTFIDKYLKVKKVIESCKTLDHTKVTKQMIENLHTVNLRCNFIKEQNDFQTTKKLVSACDSAGDH